MVLKGETPDYIHSNVVHVSFFFKKTQNPSFTYQHTQGYKKQRAFIIAQSPMQSTARDFWKVIYDKKCGVIVMLCNLMEDGKVTSVCHVVLL